MAKNPKSPSRARVKDSGRTTPRVADTSNSYPEVHRGDLERHLHGVSAENAPRSIVAPRASSSRPRVSRALGSLSEQYRSDDPAPLTQAADRKKAIHEFEKETSAEIIGQIANQQTRFIASIIEMWFDFWFRLFSFRARPSRRRDDEVKRRHGQPDDAA